MTYNTGGNIQATDYNTFATLSGSMNEIFSDIHSGATTLPTAGYGYGQTPALTTVSAGGAVTAAQWAALYQTMRNCGTHQGTTVVPPLPSSNPSAGSSVSAYNTPSTLASVISTLHTNCFQLAALQSTLTVGSNFTQPGPTIPWTTSLTFHYQVDFGSWNNARYFFNSGGSLNLNGSYPDGGTGSVDHMWHEMLVNMSPLVFNYNSTAPFTGGGGSSLGFYNLTTSYQTIYNHLHGGGGYYTNSYIQVTAKLTAAAGTNGVVDFIIALVDADVTPNAKSGTSVFRIDNSRATGAIVYPGTISIASVGANSGFTSV